MSTIFSKYTEIDQVKSIPKVTTSQFVMLTFEQVK